ncbi:hypothetical protein V5O48_009173 [Marasmius crinis-equi]|uniref:Uncharacterized protein n=1 Tax=Marasmius crinis-equi TaxID=585013 RepID=A0ABR3FC66_9AGAR
MTLPPRSRRKLQATKLESEDEPLQQPRVENTSELCYGSPVLANSRSRRSQSVALNTEKEVTQTPALVTEESTVARSPDTRCKDRNRFVSSSAEVNRTSKVRQGQQMTGVDWWWVVVLSLRFVLLKTYVCIPSRERPASEHPTHLDSPKVASSLPTHPDPPFAGQTETLGLPGHSPGSNLRGRNTWVNVVFGAIDRNVCRHSMYENLDRWRQYVLCRPESIPFFEATQRSLGSPTHVKLCAGLSATFRFTFDLLAQDLFECYTKGLPVYLVDAERGTPTQPSDAIVTFFHALMVPHKSHPFAVTSIPFTSKGMGKLALNFHNAYAVHGDSPPHVTPKHKTTYSPAGHISLPPLEPFPADSVVHHCYGRCVWVFFASSSSNFNKLHDSLTLQSLEEWMAALEGPEVLFVETPGTTFVIPAGTITAYVSLSTSVYTSAAVAPEQSLGRSRKLSEKGSVQV